MTDSYMLDTDQVVRLSGLTRQQLLDRIRRGTGPRAFKFGHKTFKFAKPDVAEWLASRVVEPDAR